MASNFNNDDQNWRSLIEYILTTDTVLGDPANLVPGSSFMGKINQVLQKMIDNLNWLRSKLPGNANTTTAGLVERLTQAEARLGTDTTRYASIATILDALRNGTPFRATATEYGVVKLPETSTLNVQFKQGSVSGSNISHTTQIEFSGKIAYLQIKFQERISAVNIFVIITGGKWQLITLSNRNFSEIKENGVSALKHIDESITVENNSGTTIRLSSTDVQSDTNDTLNMILLLAD